MQQQHNSSKQEARMTIYACSSTLNYQHTIAKQSLGSDHLRTSRHVAFLAPVLQQKAATAAARLFLKQKPSAQCTLPQHSKFIDAQPGMSMSRNHNQHLYRQHMLTYQQWLRR
jgi:hypothetical protein